MSDKYDPSGLTRARYKELLTAEKVLLALEAAGVDNWEGYCLAFDDEEEKEDDE